jgi:hypothetical protein
MHPVPTQLPKNGLWSTRNRLSNDCYGTERDVGCQADTQVADSFGSNGKTHDAAPFLAQHFDVEVKQGIDLVASTITRSVLPSIPG